MTVRYRGKNKAKRGLGDLLLAELPSILVAAALVVILLCSATVAYWTAEDVTFTVKSKERVLHSNKSYYLVFTDDEVFVNRDSLLYFKFNSSDVHGRLDVGKTYSAKVYGWRIRFMSVYRNIVAIKEG